MPAIPIVINPENDPWVFLIGKFMVNFGAIEYCSVEITEILAEQSGGQLTKNDLKTRLNWIKKRVPKDDIKKHKKFTHTLTVAGKLASFRDIVAHSCVFHSFQPPATVMVGLLNLYPKDRRREAELVSETEMKGRINELSNVIRDINQLYDYIKEQRSVQAST